MKSNITVSIDSDIMKKIREKNFNTSKLAEEAFRNALTSAINDLPVKQPKLSRLQELNKLLGEYKIIQARKYNLAIDKFLRLHNSRLPNFNQTKDLDKLLSLVLEQLKQKKLDFNQEGEKT